MIRFAADYPALADDRVRHHILEHVDRNGPSSVSSLPHQWPLIGFHLRRIAAQLARDGLVSMSRDDEAPPLMALTEAGRALLPTPSRDP
jgi:hypothetical protein